MQKLYKVTIKTVNCPEEFKSEEVLNFGNYNEALAFVELFEKHLNIYRKIINYKGIKKPLEKDDYSPLCFGHMKPSFIEKVIKYEVSIEINETFMIYSILDDQKNLVSDNIKCPICRTESTIREYEKHEIVVRDDEQFLIACKYNKCSECENSYVTYENYQDEEIKSKYRELMKLYEKYNEVLNEKVEGPLFNQSSDRNKKTMSSRYTC